MNLNLSGKERNIDHETAHHHSERKPQSFRPGVTCQTKYGGRQEAAYERQVVYDNITP